MPGIIPNASAGAIEVRDASGNCLAPAGVSNAYCPPATFVTTCAINYLPDGCGASITAAQMNAFQSELICLAEKFNPTGTWNCGSLCNLSGMFNSWMTGSYAGSLKDRVQQILCASPTMTQTQLTSEALAAFLMCNGAGGVMKYYGRPYVTAVQVVAAICASAPALASLQDCIKQYPEVAVALNSGLTVTKTTAVDGHDIYTIGAVPAADTIAGVVKLAVAANYPQHANDIDAVTPAYLKAALDFAIAALPSDKFLQGLQSYNATTNVMTLLMSDGSTVAVDMTALLNDALATIPDDATTPLANIAALGDANRGLSLGEVDIPTNRALTIAEMTQVNADSVGIPLVDMQSLFTNRAAEPAAPGFMNANGTLGFSMVPVVTLAAAVAGYNGASVSLAVDGSPTYAIPDGRYVGQMLELTTAGNGLEIILTGNFRGILRNSQHVQTFISANTSVIMRLGETLMLRWTGTHWLALTKLQRQLYGVGWRELTNGRAIVEASGSDATAIPGGGNLVFDATLPVAVSNPLSLRQSVYDYSLTSPAPGLGTITGTTPISFTSFPVANTPTTVRLGSFNLDTSSSVIIGAYRVFVPNAILDYAALGGVASF